jgi:hypothetical protein
LHFIGVKKSSHFPSRIQFLDIAPTIASTLLQLRENWHFRRFRSNLSALIGCGSSGCEDKNQPFLDFFVSIPVPNSMEWIIRAIQNIPGLLPVLAD